MFTRARLIPQFIALLFAASVVVSVRGAEGSNEVSIKHSYLVLGGKTAIIGEDGKTQWEYAGGSRDGFVLPNGNVLLAYADRVEEVVPAGERLNQTVFTYKRSKENGEISTAQRLYNGNTLVTELGKRPRLLEVPPPPHARLHRYRLSAPHLEQQPAWCQRELASQVLSQVERLAPRQRRRCVLAIHTLPKYVDVLRQHAQLLSHRQLIPHNAPDAMAQKLIV